MITERFQGFQELLHSRKLPIKKRKEKKPIPKINFKELSPKQKELYGRLMIGLRFYTQEQLLSIEPAKRKAIQKRYRRAQRMLNIWKQEITIAKSNTIFEKYFPKSKLMNELCSNKFTSKNYINTLTFKQLKIGKKHIILKLIENNFLPHNFGLL